MPRVRIVSSGPERASVPRFRETVRLEQQVRSFAQTAAAQRSTPEAVGHPSCPAEERRRTAGRLSQDEAHCPPATPGRRQRLQAHRSARQEPTDPAEAEEREHNPNPPAHHSARPEPTGSAADSAPYCPAEAWNAGNCCSSFFFLSVPVRGGTRRRSRPVAARRWTSDAGIRAYSRRPRPACVHRYRCVRGQDRAWP